MLTLLVILARIPGARAQQAPEIVVDPVLEVRARAAREAEVGSEPLGALQERARVGLEVGRLGVSARATLQVARSWRGSDAFVEAAFTPELAEGWVRLDGRLSEGLGAVLTIGRQIVHVHEGRILGADDFGLRGRQLEALRLSLDLAPVAIELINARRWAEEDPLGLGITAVRAGVGRDDVLNAWLVDGLLLVDGRNTGAATTTTGFYTRVSAGRARVRAEGYAQIGAGFALFGGGRAGWVFGSDDRLQLAAALDRSSGDGGGRVAFAPVLGDTRPFWGIVGAFASPEGSDRLGLTDASLRAEWRVARPLEIDATVHRFWATVGGAALGLEADLEGRWWVSPLVSFGAGYGELLAGKEYGRPSRGFGYGEIDARF